ncbi:MAG: hypothetical protein B6I28_02145 [Fusobacteriia bacterium 4572_132]|nr:MAG: hypothetical protein B6I28_02145 [Fusobacteriia bacterium 4572_132]
MKMQKKLMFMMVVPIVTFFFILSILDLKYQEEEKYKALNKEINRTNRILTLINLDPFWNVNLETLETIAKEISEKTEIVKYELITEKEEKIISITKNLKPNIEYRLEIIKGNTKIGTLIVGYTYKYIYEYIKKLKLRILFYGLIMTVFLIIIIYYISKWFSKLNLIYKKAQNFKVLKNILIKWRIL